MSIKLVIVDDHKIVRDGLKMFLEKDEALDVIADFESLKGLFEYLEKHTPNLILMDFRLPDGDGINATLKVKRNYPKVKVILLTAFNDKEIVLSALEAKVDAVVFKSVEEDELYTIIHEVYHGNHHVETYLPSAYFKKEEDVAHDLLSPRQRTILTELSLGKTNAEIACDLGIAEKTVRNNLHEIYKKIHVSNRTEATAYWMKIKH